MFKRQIRTYLTLNLPNKCKEITNSNTNKKCREFAVGETVQCRNYNGKDKCGTITQRIGKLHYRVSLEDGRIWERHVDQILQLRKPWIQPEDHRNTEDLEETRELETRLEDNNTAPLPVEEEEIQQVPREEVEGPEPEMNQRRQLPARNRRPPM